jgi:hypothetical protein
MGKVNILTPVDRQYSAAKDHVPGFKPRLAPAESDFLTLRLRRKKLGRFFHGQIALVT